MSSISLYKVWLEQVQQKNDWPHYASWTNKEYNQLSDEIEQACGVLINRNTLRHFVERVASDDKKYHPQSATRDAFAEYLGYRNWIDYSKKRKTKKRPLLIGGVVFLVIVASIPFVLNTNSNLEKLQEVEYSFKVQNPEGMAPHTVRTEFRNEDKIRSMFYMDFGTINLNGDYAYNEMDGIEETVSNFCYHFPDVYRLRLYNEQLELESKPVVVYSDNWFYYVTNAQGESVEIPPFKTNKALFLPWLNFDGVLKEQSGDGYFHIPLEEIAGVNGISSNYNIGLRLVQDFGVNLKDVELEVRFKNEYFGDGLNCYEARLHIYGEKPGLMVKFVEPGCDNYATYRMGPKLVMGSKSDLSILQLNFKEFVKVNMRIKNKAFEVLVDDKMVLHDENKFNLGSFYAIDLKFKGTPHVDYVKVFTKDSILVNQDY